MDNNYFCVFHNAETAFLPQNSIVLDGKEMMTIEQFYNKISSKLQFPDSFGHNLDALFDCLSDLDWIADDAVSIVIENTKYWLKNETHDTKSNLILTLFDAAESLMESPLYEDGREREITYFFQHSSWLEEMMDENALIWKYID